MERNKLKELQNSYQEKNNKLNELNNLRDNYSKKMNHYFMERRSITVEMEEKKQQYRSFKLNQLQAKQQKIKEDRERKNLELEKQSLEKKLEDIDVLPYREELALIENMLAYLKKLQEEFKLEESKKQQNAAKKINGEVETNENKDDNKTKNENNNKKAKSKKDKQKTFKLDMNILCYFVTAGINPPVSFDEIDSCIQKLHEKKDMYEQKRDEIKVANKGKEEYNKKKKDIVTKIDCFQSDIDKLENERRSILDDIEKKQKHKKELKVNAQNMKKQIGFENEEDIEKKIREIENKLMTSTISIKEEKLLINQIQALNKNKPLLSSYSKIENEASKYDDETIGN